MATIVARAPALPTRTSTPPPHLTLNTSSRGTPAAVPNKHIPVCSPGPRPTTGLETPPASPPQKNSTLGPSSVLYPPSKFEKLAEFPPVYSLSAPSLAEAIEHLATQPLPDPKKVFPWLHGLHPENQIQLAFFLARRKAGRKLPQCIRGISVVKAGGNLSNSKLKGAISPEDILLPPSDSEASASFIDIDPRDGFSVRNFQIQACKLSTVSDIVVYGDEATPKDVVMDLARKISHAQQTWQEKQISDGDDPMDYHTFVLSDSFQVIEENHGDLVAVNSKGFITGKVVDFFYWERKEMCEMSKASEISQNVFLGPSPDPAVNTPPITDEMPFDIFIETTDLAQVPEDRSFRQLNKLLEDPGRGPLHLEFPSSGSIMPPTWSQTDVDGLMAMCRWIYGLTHSLTSEDNSPTSLADDDVSKDSDGDSIMLSTFTSSSSASANEKRILIHCTDGYTETSLLGLAYFMYAEGLPVHDAWVRLHREKGRNFFAYQSDVALLTSIQPRILQESPAWNADILHIKEPSWLGKLDGSLPSRILPYMYLGNLGHANNPYLLKELGITRILSVGEPVTWSKEVLEQWGDENLLYIDRVQDNGVDPLTDEFDRCLRFIEKGKLDNTATLVHCRVGVSRSATICIAEVMNELGLSFPRAYCFVRARRLNVIIQPHLRFTYELLKWEEYQRVRRGLPLRRELEWATVAREIAAMNKPYSRQ